MDVVYCNLETLFPCVFPSVHTVDGHAMKTQHSERINQPALEKGVHQRAERGGDDCESTDVAYQGGDGGEDQSGISNGSKRGKQIWVESLL